MIKLIMLVKRKNTLSYEEFDNYWLEHHATLVNSQKEALGIYRYVQSVPLQDKKPMLCVIAEVLLSLIMMEWQKFGGKVKKRC